MKPIKLKQDMEKINLKKAGKDFAKRFTGVMSRLADEDTNTLREEFYNWAMKQGDFIPIVNQMDWWLNKFNQKLEEIERDLEKNLKIATKRKNDIENDPFHPARNQYLGQEDAFKFALQIIKNKKN